MEIQSNWLINIKKYINRFVTLSNQEWTNFSSNLKPVFIKKDQFYIKVGDKTIKIGFIIQGLLKTFFIGENGNEYITDFCCENEISANYQILNQSKESEHYCQALEDTIILQINIQSIQKLETEVLYWKKIKENLINYYYNEKLKREQKLLSLSAEEKYIHFLQEKKKLINRIPQFQIASYLGITPVTLSRIKKNIKNIS